MRNVCLAETRAASAALVAFFGSCLALTSIVLMFQVSPAFSQARLKQEPLILKTAAGDVTISIEIAETTEQKAKGLMFRKSLDDKAGMLFPYGQPQEITMWMKNTYIPLDMVFIRDDGVIHRIEAMTEPFSLTTVASQGQVSAVLELNGGAAARLGVKPGDLVQHRVFEMPRK